jgi:DNA-binding Lrp family transcriptional regulator
MNDRLKGGKTMNTSSHDTEFYDQRGFEERQIGKILEFEPRKCSEFWFACVDIQVIKDKTLSPCDKTVYSVICAHADVETRTCSLRVKTIAEEANCSVRSVQESLKALVERGVIERTERFENGKQKASSYKIIGHKAKCYKNTDLGSDEPNTADKGAEPAPIAKNVAEMGADFALSINFCTHRDAENDSPSLREPNINDIKDYSPSEREASLPPQRKPEEKSSDLFVFEDILDDVPLIMRETLDYFLLKTGREGISPEELSAIRALKEIHTPSRVNREIFQAMERFKKRPGPPQELTLVYVYRSLQYQNSIRGVHSGSPPSWEAENSGKADPYAGAYL